MRSILTLLLLLLFVFSESCNGKDSSTITYPKEKTMNTEKFDIEKFRKCQLETGSSHCEDKLSDNVIVKYSASRSSKNGLFYTKTFTPPPPAMYIIVKHFYPSGIIKQETKSFIGSLMIPPFYNSIITTDYDEKGQLIKSTDNTNFDKDVKIKLKELLELLQREPIIREVLPEEKENYSFYLFHQELKKEDVTAEKVIKVLLSEDCNGKILNPDSDFDRRNIIISLENKEWKVTKDIYPRGFFDYVFDANSGKLKSVKYRGDQRS